MDRINTATKALDLFGPGKHGFKDGNLSLAIQPTTLEAAFFNDLQEELVGVIEGAGLVPTAGVRTQLRQAIEIMISGSTGNDYKASVRVATTANIASLNGGAPNTLDGIALAANNRILVKDQATPSQNGIYYVATLGTGANGIWLRAVDADGAGELSPGTLVTVEEGTAQADTLWLLSTDGPITVGTTGIQFVRRDSGAANTSQLASGSAVPSANTLVVTLDPSTTDFRSTTLTSGARVSVTSSSAISLTVPETATLGTQNGVAARLAVLEINYAGVKEVAIVNLAGGTNLDETQLISTTAMSTGADSANVIYSQTARAGVAFRVRMFVDIVQANAGVWSSPALLVQGLGGRADLGNINSTAPVPTTSGSSIDLTGIPAQARRIVLNFAGVSTNGGANVILQLGTSGGVETSGYLGVLNAGTPVNLASSIAVDNTAGAGRQRVGVIIFNHIGANLWSFFGIFAMENIATMCFVSGRKQLAGQFDRVRITNNGADNFNGGSVNLSWEQ